MNIYSKVQMNFSPKLGSFQKNERQIRNQWRQIYQSERMHREYTGVRDKFDSSTPFMEKVEYLGSNMVHSENSKSSQ